MFDTINNNGDNDFEFSPKAPKQWNSDKYWKKQHNMAYTISQLTHTDTPDGPAVIGVSEVENLSVLKDLVNQPELKDRGYQIVHHDSPDRRGIDVALLYNPKYFKVLNVTNQHLYIPSYKTFKTRDQLCVTGLLAGEKVSIMVNHWTARSGDPEPSSYLREAEAKQARETIDSLLLDDPTQGVIFMGDLNDNPSDKSCSVVLRAMKNMNEVTGSFGVYNPWWSILERGTGSLSYQSQWNLFDQIVMTEYFTHYATSSTRPHLTFQRAEVFNRSFLSTTYGTPKRTFSGDSFQNGYSDHYPTRIFLTKQVPQ
ncbi:MAG: endonuclease/exonuclease/phosphatase family protein [Bacteroidales bacterium]|nr:endonuclease/exonuclease/phosphatase family protein [Candidatus Sodaliphilus aphodohippi]